jgi:serine phosphatase RsbU (regulator of sigma subunit)/uncharacterized protein YigA (DUF484 family)
MSVSDLLIALAGIALGAVLVGAWRWRRAARPAHAGGGGALTPGASRSTLELAHSRAQRLHRLAAALSRAASAREVATAFLDQALEQLGAQGGSLVLRSADGTALDLVAGREIPGAKARLRDRIPLDQHFSVTEAFRTGEPVWARDFEELRTKFPTSAATFGSDARAIYALPLVVGGETAGAFNLWFERDHEVSAEDADFLATMAQLCGQALERALLAEAETRARASAEEAARYATSLYSLGMRLATSLTPIDVAMTVMREAITEHGAAAAAVGLIDPEVREVELLIDDDYPEQALEILRRFSLDAPFPAAAAARSAKPVFVRTLEEREREFPELPRTLGDGSVAIAALPLIAANRAFGVLVLRYSGERAFQSDERRFLLTLADDCSQALDRARLHAEAEHQAARATLLLRIAKSLDAASGYGERAAALLNELVPELADFASIEGVDAEGAPATLASRQMEGAVGEDAATLHEEAIKFVERVASWGVPECIKIGSGEVTGSCVAVPLAGGTRSTTALLAISVAGDREAVRPDVSLFSEIGRGAALALENARLYEREHHIAQTLQQGLLPPALPHTPGFEFAVAFIPMGEGNQVGGDFYDVFKKGEVYTAVVGDVCGKGPEAAKLTALCRHTLRTAAMLGGAGPSRTLALLNRAILDQVPSEQFCTVAAADLLRTERGTVRATISSAGHPSPLVARRDGSVELQEVLGTVLGVVEVPRLDEMIIELEVGDTLVFVTDGVDEARSEDGSLFGLDRLRAAIERAAGSVESVTAAAIVAAIRNDVNAFCGSRELRDDVVILAIRCTPAEPPSPVARPLQLNGWSEGSPPA